MKGSDTNLEGSDTPVMNDVWGVLDTILDTGMGGIMFAFGSFEIQDSVGPPKWIPKRAPFCYPFQYFPYSSLYFGIAPVAV